MLPLIAFSQKSDSTRLVPVPKYKLDKLLQSYFFLLPLCDSTVQKQQKAIDTLNLALQASMKLDSVHVAQRDNKQAEVTVLRQQADNDEAIHKDEKKQERKTGRTEGAVVGGIIGLIMTVLALLAD